MPVEATVSSSTTFEVTVQCEACDCVFRYPRVVQATDKRVFSSGWFLDNKMDKMKVRVNEIHQYLTQEFLAGKLHKPMRCPNCHYMQSWMIDTYLNQIADDKASKISFATAIGLMVIFTIAGIIFNLDIFLLILGSFLISVLLSLTVYIILKTRFRKSAIHPNLEYLSRNPVPTRTNQPIIRLARLE